MAFIIRQLKFEDNPKNQISHRISKPLRIIFTTWIFSCNQWLVQRDDHLHLTREAIIDLLLEVDALRMRLKVIRVIKVGDTMVLLEGLRIYVRSHHLYNLLLHLPIRCGTLLRLLNACRVSNSTSSLSASIRTSQTLDEADLITRESIETVSLKVDNTRITVDKGADNNSIKSKIRIVKSIIKIGSPEISL